MAERIALYIDGANVYFAQKEALGWWIDWPRFLDTMRQGRELVYANWYQAYRANPEPEQERFLHHLSMIGFAVRKKVCKQITDRLTGDVSLKGNLDIEVTIDALTQSEHYDTAIFVTGDSDFVPLLEALQHRGKRVMVVATQQNVAVELRQVVGVNYQDLRDMRHRIESDKRPPEPREREESSQGRGNGESLRVGSAGPRRLAEDADDFDEDYDDDFDEDRDDDLVPQWRRSYVEGEDFVDEEPMIDPYEVELPPEGAIIRARVQTVKKYGVFLDLHEHAKTLLHVKDMHRGFVPDAGEFYRVGEEVMVQIVSIDREKSPPEVRVEVVTPEMEY